MVATKVHFQHSRLTPINPCKSAKYSAGFEGVGIPKAVERNPPQTHATSRLPRHNSRGQHVCQNMQKLANS